MKRILVVFLGLLVIGAISTVGLAATTTANGQLFIIVNSYGEISVDAGDATITVTNPASGTYVSSPDFDLGITSNSAWTLSASMTWNAGFNPFNADAVYFGPVGGGYVAQGTTFASGTAGVDIDQLVEAELNLTRVSTGLPLAAVASNPTNHGDVVFTLTY